MLPQFLYDALPYIYISTGALVAISIANTRAFISGALFGAIALYLFIMRGKFTRKGVHATSHSTIKM